MRKLVLNFKMSRLSILLIVAILALWVAVFATLVYRSKADVMLSFNIATPIGSTTDVSRAVAIQSDGKIVSAGYTQNGSYSNFALVRYNASDGSLDTTFGTGGIVTTAVGGGSVNSLAYDVAIDGDGKIVAAGWSGNNMAVARYNTDGSLDDTFDGDPTMGNYPGNGKATLGTGNYNPNFQYEDVAILSDGKIMVGGTSRTASGSQA